MKVTVESKSDKSEPFNFLKLSFKLVVEDAFEVEAVV